MKALLVCAAPAPGFEEFTARLAADSDTVVAVDGGGAACLAAGVTPNLLVGDLDSIDPAVSDALAALGVLFQTHPTEKDETDLEIAIREARRLKATEIVVTAATTGRLDHTLGVLSALAASADLLPTIAEPDMWGWLLSDNGRRTIELAGPGSLVSLVPFGAPARVSARGVRWPLEYADMNPATALGISNVVEDTQGATITVHSGDVFVLSARDVCPPAILVS
jgi:thiamine pyrophosphokinase